MELPERVTLIEVGPRDGLQNEKNFINAKDKIHFISLLKNAGFQEMELTSFVSPKWVPQMQDAGTVIEHCMDDLRNFVLAPNKKGIDMAIEAGVKHIAVFVGVSDSFNKKNINKTTEESMNELRPLIEDLKRRGYFVRACISTSFYCPFEGKIDEHAVLKVCQDFEEMGVDELSVADTIGMANPIECFDLFTLLKHHLRSTTLITGHFHDTRGMALANIFASMQAGIDRFDTSAGGLGGCPFAPGASGNVASEDVVYMLSQMGISTGIQLDKLLEASAFISPLLSKPVSSKQFGLLKNVLQG
ncbi:hydroxymethylglutaryl-CoA lyase [Fictibacillus arsenicus]|jgi:hydroxymethylglutaryl-CoA lyase|uniref:Hydroxymethylglutaryl-CoA lyase n=1 Tax=Fictibacillus arsenicus TaxID=255247 RepID=A0A1B1Z5N3_9BACL|nr:hydroxymethylglutaryl-CoA lyase [Fictibacillus arsenicus]ANX12787.1 hydroxymethylglutaryl-CoA lyase [Fictibacillus arsenicus]